MRAMSRQTPAGMSSMKKRGGGGLRDGGHDADAGQEPQQERAAQGGEGAERHEQERHGEAGCQQSRLHARRRPGLPPCVGMMRRASSSSAFHMPPASGLSDIGERPFPSVPRTVE